MPREDELASTMSETLTTLTHLPIEIKRKLAQMGTLDEEASKLLNDANDMTCNFIRNAQQMTRSSRASNKAAIRRLHGDCFSISEQKVTIAKDLSEIVDEHILRLDESLSKFEEGLLKAVAKRPEVRDDSDTSDTPLASKKRKIGSTISKESASLRKAARSSHKELSLLTHSILKHSVFSHDGPVDLLANKDEIPTTSAGGLDMPVDPHEPTYCVCHNVSYGEMVGCDNPDCTIEWFHFACVGLTEQPAGEWFCPRCEELLVKDGHPSTSSDAASSKKRKKFAAMP